MGMPGPRQHGLGLDRTYLLPILANFRFYSPLTRSQSAAISSSERFLVSGTAR